MGVTDLAGKSGMIFTFAVDANEQFWMYQTVMPLSIAFFDSTGAFVSVDRHGAMPGRTEHVPGLPGCREVPRRDRSPPRGIGGVGHRPWQRAHRPGLVPRLS